MIERTWGGDLRRTIFLWKTPYRKPGLPGSAKEKNAVTNNRGGPESEKH